MDKDLIDLLFMSQKRRDLLLLLKNGGRTIEEIVSMLHVNTDRDASSNQKTEGGTSGPSGK